MVYQIGALEALARVAGTRVAYVKPHGALYNAAVHHEGQARAVVDAVAVLRPVAAAAGPARLAAARRPASEPGCAPCARPSPTAATPRRRRSCRAAEPGAVLYDPEEVADRVVGW